MRSEHALALLLILAGLGLCAFIQYGAPGNRGTDFNQYRSAAVLAGSGRVYDSQALEAQERVNSVRLVPFGRLPFFAVVLKPFTWIPYETGRLAWMGLSVLAAAGFLLLWPLSNRLYATVAMAWSLPFWVLLNYGQDTMLPLFLAAAGLWLLIRKRDWVAGLVLSLLAAKFHLALGIPVLLVGMRRWRALAGGAAGGAVILAVSFWSEGLAWPARLVALSHRPDFNPASWRMPNLAGLFEALPGSLVWEVALGVAALWAVYRIARTRSVEVGMAAALAGGLLVSHHAQFYDCVLLLPVVLMTAREAWRPMRWWSAALVTPVPYYWFMDERLSLWARLLVVGFVLVWLWREGRRPLDSFRVAPVGAGADVGD